MGFLNEAPSPQRTSRELPLQPPASTREAVDAAIARGLVTIPAKVFENGAKVEKRTIRKWRDRVEPYPFDEAPDAHLWAHRTGEAWGLVILDFDTESVEGPAAKDALERSGLRPHRRSGSGGFHVEVEHPGWKVKTFAGALPGVDVRGDGGVVYFAGVSHKGAYEQAADHPPYKVEEVPGWLRQAAGLAEPPAPKTRPASRREYAGDGLGTPTGLRLLAAATASIQDAPTGEGNSTLNKQAFSVAGLVAAGHLDEGYARDEVEAAGEHRWDGDVAAVVDAAWSQGIDQPWEPDNLDASLDDDAWQEVRGSPPHLPADAPPNDFEARTMTLEQILNRPSPRWLVPGLLQEASLAQLVGPPSAGKSLLALQWSIALVEAGGRVLYAAAEGLGGFPGRLRAQAKHRGVEPIELPVPTFYVAPVNLADAEAVDDLVAWAERYGPWDLIVIDTLARAIPGVEENSSKEMGQAVHAAERLKQGSGAVLLVHHSGHGSSRGRGSSAVLAAADNVIHCFPENAEHNGREGRPLHIKVTAEKLKDGRASPPLHFRAEEIPLGDDWSSVVLVPNSAEDFAAERLDNMRAKVQRLRDEGVPWVKARDKWRTTERAAAKVLWDEGADVTKRAA